MRNRWRYERKKWKKEEKEITKKNVCAWFSKFSKTFSKLDINSTIKYKYGKKSVKSCFEKYLKLGNKTG